MRLRVIHKSGSTNTYHIQRRFLFFWLPMDSGFTSLDEAVDTARRYLSKHASQKRVMWDSKKEK